MVPGDYLCDPLRESIYRLYLNGIASHGYLLARTRLRSSNFRRRLGASPMASVVAFGYDVTRCPHRSAMP